MMINMRTIRLAKGLTQEQVSKVVGVNCNTICQWERGSREPDFSSLIKLADFFKVFGMMGGLTAIAFLQEKTAPISYDVVWWKKLLRIVIGVVLALALKESLKVLKMGNLRVDLMLDAIRYFAVALAVGYLCPLLFKKIKL